MDISGVYYCSKCMLQMEEEGVCPHCGYAPGQAGRDRKQLEEGTFLNERYLLGAVIGSGGFGITYAAWDTLLEAPVAIKEYFPRDYAERDVRDSDEVLPRNNYETEYKLGLRRFMQEARVLAMFREVRGIVNVSDCFEENETFYFVMEYVRGVSLKEYVKKHHTGPQELLGMMRSTIDALEAVHSMGILHRDITPQNLMVLEDGSVKLIDFGAARKIDREGSSIIVTEHYAPIEQYESSRGQGPWTDIYSLCATIYEMLTGAAPQESLARKYSDELNLPSKAGVRLKKYQERALMTGLAVEPSKRIRSMAELRSRLYNLPLPEEILRRKAFVRKVSAVSALILAVCAILAINFTTGLPVYRGLMLSLMPDGWHIIDCHTEEEAYIIPEKCLGIGISSIDHGAFADMGSLRSVEIPGSIEDIKEQAFFGCDNLENIVVNEGTENIADFAFAQNPALRNVQLPESLEYMSPTALSGAHERLRIWGKHGSYAEEYAFTGGDAQARITREAEYAKTDDSRLYTGEIPFLCRDDFVIEETEGGIKIVDCSPDEHAVVFPDFIEGKPVVELQDEIFSIGEFASLRYICLPYDLQVLPNLKDDALLDDDSFEETKRYDFGPNLREIGEYGLSACGAEEIVLPEGLQVLGEDAFTCSHKLKSVKLPGTLKEIGDSAFADTDFLTEIDLPESTELLMPGAFEHSSIEEIILPENITSIPSNAFEFCVDLEKVVLPPVVTDIGNFAFFNCQWLSYLEIPAGLKYIGGRAFKDCVSLQAVRFLGDCEGLAIGTEAFGYCKSMEYIYLPDGTASIGSYAFSECRNMKVIHIPPTVNEIADDAFAGCRSTLVISGSAGSYAEAYAIEHGITFENESVWIHVESAFIAENSDGLPIALALSYESAEAEEAVLASFCNGLPVVQMWEPTVIPVKAKRIVMPLMLESFVSDNGIDCEELVFRRELEQFAFWLNDYEGMDSAVKSIRNIEFSNGTQNFWVLENGFSGTGVREVRLPANLMYVEQEAFAYCPNLETVIFPDVIEFMDARCFRESPALKEIELPEGDISLCCIFAGCRQLETVILPESVKSLPFCSFAGCTSLKDVWIYSRELELEYETSVSHFHYELEKYYDPDFEAYDGTDLWTSILHTWETHLPHPFADSPSLTIHGYAGSDVEAFCNEWGLNFEPIPENE